MYMLLIIYSFININNVSWGTREVVPTATEQAQAQQEAQQQAAQDQQRRKSIVDKVFDVFRGKNVRLVLRCSSTSVKQEVYSCIAKLIRKTTSRLI